jgi:hypothetical protein
MIAAWLAPFSAAAFQFLLANKGFGSRAPTSKVEVRADAVTYESSSRGALIMRSFVDLTDHFSRQS